MANASAVCGALRSGLSSLGHSPAPTFAISPAMAIHRVAERSISARFLALRRLDHERPGDRKDMVGAWKP